ncbi:hypothetical protein ACQKCU_24035 [Heyndrickxia sporothermodurans]
MAQITLEELEAKLLEENLKVMFQKAYEQGVADGQKRFNLPYTLTRNHLKEIFQVELPTVDKITAHPTFPKFQLVRARYPRDQVLEWINKNSDFIEKTTLNRAI